MNTKERIEKPREFDSEKYAFSKLIAQLLKWQFHPSAEVFWNMTTQSNSTSSRNTTFSNTIRKKRNKISEIIQKNPKLKDQFLEEIEQRFAESKEILREDRHDWGFKNVPDTCPYTFEQIMNDTFYPE